MLKILKFASNYAVFVFLLLVVVLIMFPSNVVAAVYNSTNVCLSPGSSMNELNLCWYSTANTSSRVQIALKSAMSGSEFPESESNTYLCTVTSSSTGYYSNKALVAGLTASTEYVYRLGDGAGNWTANYFYKTYAADHFSFLAVGDPQIGSSNTTTDTNGWNNTLNVAQQMFPSMSLIMSTGDQVETNNSESQCSGFLSPSQLTGIPVAPTLGNHDNGANQYNYHYKLPNLSTQYGITSPGSADYYFTYGNAIFMVINTNNTSGATHNSFIQQAIASNPDKVWRIVMFHHDIYGSANHSTDSTILNLRAALFPVFDANDIDVVITGHDHCYTRTYQMLGDIPQTNQTVDGEGNVVNPTGTVYFTLNSASGSKYYSLKPNSEVYSAIRSQINIPTFSHAVIDGGKLTFSTYRTDNMQMTDTYSILKTSTAPTATTTSTSTPTATQTTATPTSTQQTTATPTPTQQSGSTIIEIGIAADMDDVEEKVSNGSIYSNSSDLELSCDGSANQYIGMRFNGINIPKDATITKAYIQFTCDEIGSGAASLTIKGQASDNADSFTTGAYNVSSRTRTQAAVNWTPSAWNTVGAATENERTPDLQAIIQQIINRAGWSNGNSMVIIISGTDGSSRCAESYVGGAQFAPLLHIEYTSDTPHISTLFSDGFESNNFTAGGWINSECNTQTTYKYAGSFAARFNSSDCLTKQISTVGKNNIQLKYARYSRYCESNDHFICEWYDGSSWFTLEDLTGNSGWTVKTWNLPEGSWNNAGFNIRFKTSHNGSSDYVYLDNVEITGQ